MCKPTMNPALNNSVDTEVDNFAGDNLNNSLEDAFKLLEQERLISLMQVLRRTIIAKVIPCCTKVLDLEGSLLELPGDMLKNMLLDMVHLGEQEPYGVKGGTLILKFGNAEPGIESLENPSETLNFTKIGRFPLNPAVTSTFELHLTLYPSTCVKHKLANFIRKLKGKPCKLVVGDKFSLTKKKLYRSPSHVK